MKSMAVFCGSRDGASPAYREGAVTFGKELARRQITLVYGGSSLGTMGILADTVLEHGGKVIGVMPNMLADREIAHKNLTELHIVGSMHERKAKMADLADAFVAMPGGPGTMDEFFEIFTWAQIGIHRKPMGMYNVNRYYDPLLAVFDHMVKEQFLPSVHREMIHCNDKASDLIELLLQPN
ncbi:LOG family protein [Bacillus testis]|uniref:LOG family protein n=1 Tax=Bacillus testis TaxID=1622072 RepID=UPI00067F5797|nr:TIGR00730 family Rossman fold protein [Bacillus testis]